MHENLWLIFMEGKKDEKLGIQYERVIDYLESGIANKRPTYLFVKACSRFWFSKMNVPDCKVPYLRSLPLENIFNPVDILTRFDF